MRSACRLIIFSRSILHLVFACVLVALRANELLSSVSPPSMKHQTVSLVVHASIAQVTTDYIIYKLPVFTNRKFSNILTT